MLRSLVLVLALAGGVAMAARIEVEPGLKGPASALEKARSLRRERPDELIEIVFPGGTYRLTETLCLGPEDSNLQISAKAGEKVILSGGIKLGGFIVEADGRWQARLEGPPFQQLWVGGRRAVRAREPDSGFFRMKGVKEEKLQNGKFRQTVEMEDDALRWLRDLSPESLEKVQMLAYHKWDNTRRFIEKVEGSSFSTIGEDMKSWNRWDTKSGLIFENVPAGLDEPGEWYLSERVNPDGDPDKPLRYIPRPGEDPKQSEVIAGGLEKLLVIEGAKHVSIRGISFAHAGWYCPPGGFEPSQAAAPVEAVIQVDNAEHITIEDCEVSGTGLYGVWFRKGCRDCKLLRSYLHDLGAGGARIGTMEQGMATSGNVIEDCIIRDGGKVFPCAVGVWIGSSGGNRVVHNEISHFAYTGVSLGWMWGYEGEGAKGNIIEGNHIHHIGNGLLSDMGGIYTLGPSEGTVLRGNRIHDIVSYDYGGWGIYNDEGSTGIVSEGNLVYRTTTGGYHQHYGKENIIRNNIFAYARDQQLQFSRPEEHVSFHFSHNIVLWDKGPLWSGGAQGKGNFECDSNLYWQAGGGGEITCFGKKFSDWQVGGHDGKSVIADPGFVDPATGNFAFKDPKAVLPLPIGPFLFQDAGVRGAERWKALAKEEPVDWKVFAH
ncbi:right-handed parallel beta-helix repeat-containing protein [Haloferula sp. BvORR071]|uniref:right-handed parallel beta-helix repeat-containing protein n=1 Tax=Haloferula sp. BvORR071 TaxID=1396141 RepID=UPI000696750B|nr:right-handed parallel beta-helix repeat-containing protein [Haloferula sp. BvORR071]